VLVQKDDALQRRARSMESAITMRSVKDSTTPILGERKLDEPEPEPEPERDPELERDL